MRVVFCTRLGVPATWWAALWLAFFADYALAQSVIRGPYLQQANPTSVVIRWRTDRSTDSRVAYGTSLGALSKNASSSSAGVEHALTLTGLRADTRYYYTVGSSARALAGGDESHSFVTPPSVGSTRASRIWVLGDSGTANSNARAVRDAYVGFNGARHTDLLLMLGDNAYPDGTDREYQAAVFDMYPEVLRQTPLWPTLGNHDGHTADSATQTGPYYEIFTLPTRAEAGGVASGTEAYYAFDHGNVHFISLESHETDRSRSGAMMRWLENDLAATDQTWIVAFWHHPPYTKGSHDSDRESSLVDMREIALPILESYGVDLVLTGHSHSYERSILLNGHYDVSSTLLSSMIIDDGDGREGGDGSYTKTGDAGSASEGAVYAVAGSSGKVSAAPLDHPAMFLSLATLGSMVLDVAGDRLDARFIDAAGEVRDRFTLQKEPVGVPPALPAPTNLTIAAVDRNRATQRMRMTSVRFP